jgi:hypothetical protein
MLTDSYCHRLIVSVKMRARFLNVLTHMFERTVSLASIVRENIMPIPITSVKMFCYCTGSYVRVEEMCTIAYVGNSIVKEAYIVSTR